MAAALALYGVHWLYEIANAVISLFFSVFGIFLASTPAFIWVYKWWGALQVFVTTYIPFFLAANLIYDKPRKTQKKFLICLWGLVTVLLVTLIPPGIS